MTNGQLGRGAAIRVRIERAEGQLRVTVTHAAPQPTSAARELDRARRQVRLRLRQTGPSRSR